MPDQLTYEWPLEVCNVKDAWKIEPPPGGEKMGKGVLILHPDTGYTNHPLLKHNLYSSGVSYLDDSENALDDLVGSNAGHGTHTASIMIVEGYIKETLEDGTVKEFYLTGISPKAKLVPMRVATNVFLGVYLGGDKTNTVSNLARAINDANSFPNVGVISISLGTWVSQFSLSNAIKSAKNKGIIICAAAGQIYNTIESKIIPPAMPASYDNVIGVAACDGYLKRYSLGLFGKGVDVTAPGVGVCHVHTSTDGYGRYSYDYGYGQGTSYATAFVSGACALWLAFHDRNNLIEKYSKSHLFDVFKYILYATSNRDIEDYKRDISGEDDQLYDSEAKKVNLYKNGVVYLTFMLGIRWGCGLIDVKALLEYPLPDIADVIKTTSEL